MLFHHVFSVESECDFCAILADFDSQLEIPWRTFFRQFAGFEGKMRAKSEVGKMIFKPISEEVGHGEASGARLL